MSVSPRGNVAVATHECGRSKTSRKCVCLHPKHVGIGRINVCHISLRCWVLVVPCRELLSSCINYFPVWSDPLNNSLNRLLQWNAPVNLSVVVINDDSGCQQHAHASWYQKKLLAFAMLQTSRGDDDVILRRRDRPLMPIIDYWIFTYTDVLVVDYSIDIT